MRLPPQARLLPDGRRLHLHDGPIDLILQADGSADAVEAAYRAAADCFSGLLDRLCDELPLLRSQAHVGSSSLLGPVARLMDRAVAPFAAELFITPMAAVAGSVAEWIMAAMTTAVRLDRAFVNNGGDIALHCAPGFCWTVGLINQPEDPGLFGRVKIDRHAGVRGIATSGWRGRSFSLGIADSVTILAASASSADAAATVVANAVDLPGHDAVTRAPATSVQCDSDLGERLVTRHVGPLRGVDIARALDAGARCAEALLARGLIIGAALQVQGTSRIVGPPSIAPQRLFAALTPNPRTRFPIHA